MNGFANWLFDVQARRMLPVVAGRPGPRRPFMPVDPLPGSLYLYVMLGTCAIAVAALLLRYRKAEE